MSNIVVFDQAFFYENRNGSDFATLTGDFTNIWKGNVGDRVKETATLQVTIDAEVTVTDSNQFEITDQGSNKKITRLSGSFIADKFLPDDIIDFINTTGGGSVLIITSGVIKSVQDTILIVAGAGANAIYTKARIAVKQSFTEVNFQYTTNGLNVKSEIDTITESVQQYKNNNVTGSFSTSNPRNPQRWLTQETDPFKIRLSATVDTYTREFEYEHIFLATHYWAESQEQNQTNLNSPNPFKNSTLQYRRIFDIGSAENLGNLRRITIPDVGVDSIGWLNESFDGGENVYTLDSVSYETVAGSNPLDDIEITESTKVSFVISVAVGTTFLTGDPITIFHSFQPVAATYKTATGTMKDIWLQETVRTTIDAAPVVGTGIIRNLDINLDTAQQISGSFETILTQAQQAQLENNNLYLLAAIVEDSTTTNNTSNRVTLKIDNSTYSKNSDISGLVVFDEANYFDHTTDFTAGVFNGKTNIALANEDIFLSAYRFHIPTTTNDQIIISKMSALIVAYNTVADTFFIIDEFNFPISRGALVNTGGQLRQVLSLDTERDFNIPIGNQFRQVFIETDNFSTPDQFYNVYVGQQIPWDENQPLAGVDTVFLDSNEPNDGLNMKTSRYSGSNNYVIRAALRMTMRFQGVDTIYIHFSGNSTVADYGESAFTATFSSTDLLDVDLNGKLLQLEDNKVKVIHDDTTTKTNPDGLVGIQRIYKENELNVFILSSLRDSLIGQIIQGLTLTLRLDKSIESDDYTTTSKIKGNLLSKVFYVVSSRIFEVFFSGFSLLFDGTNEHVDFGDVLDFETTDAFSISLWVKRDGLGTEQGLLTKRDHPSGAVDKGWFLQFNSDNRFRFDLTDFNLGQRRITVKTSQTFTSTTTWVHLVMTYDGSITAAGVTLYANGVSVATITDFDSLAGSTLNARPMLMGSREELGEKSRFLDAKQDEVSVWNKELTGAEVLETRKDGKPSDLDEHSAKANLLSWYRFDGDTIPTITDNKGSNDGTAINMDQSNVNTDVP